MNISYKIVCVTVQTVVVIVSALVGTEFLITTAMYNIAAIETSFFHNAKVLIKIQKNVFKRLQTTLRNYEPDINVYQPTP